MSVRSSQQAEAQMQSVAAMVRAYDEATTDGARDAAQQAIYEDPLSVEYRHGWFTLDQRPKDTDVPPDFSVTLCTGGPAVRIDGSLLDNGVVESARLMHQDWFEPWQPHPLLVSEEAVLVRYCELLGVGDAF